MPQSKQAYRKETLSPSVALRTCCVKRRISGAAAPWFDTAMPSTPTSNASCTSSEASKPCNHGPKVLVVRAISVQVEHTSHALLLQATPAPTTQSSCVHCSHRNLWHHAHDRDLCLLQLWGPVTDQGSAGYLPRQLRMCACVPLIYAQSQRAAVRATIRTITQTCRSVQATIRSHTEQQCEKQYAQSHRAVDQRKQ